MYLGSIPFQQQCLLSGLHAKSGFISSESNIAKYINEEEDEKEEDKKEVEKQSRNMPYMKWCIRKNHKTISVYMKSLVIRGNVNSSPI